MDTAQAGLTEQERVERWRADTLFEAGYPAVVALELAAASSVDVHQAVELLAQGCPVEVAVEILR